MKSLITKHQIKLFFLLTLIIGWFPFYTGKGSLIMAAPMISALLIVLLADGSNGLRQLTKRMTHWRMPIKWYLIIFLLPALLFALALIAHMFLGGTLPQLELLRQPLTLVMVFISFLIPLQSSAFLEEVGFRGYALEKMQNKYGPFLATTLLGLFFGGWLLPEFFNEDSFQYAMGGLDYYLWFIAAELGWSYIMTLLYNRTNKSALLSGYLLHASFNAWALILLTNVLPGEVIPAFDTPLFILSSITILITGLLVVIKTKGKLGYKVEQMNQHKDISLVTKSS